MKIAIVHDWLTGMRGGEWCLEAFLLMYPNADVFTLIHIPGTTTPRIDSRVIKTSFLSKLPGVKKYYRGLLPLFPFAAKEFDFSEYDCVISISHAAVKNITIPKGITHICYCLTPMRYIWDQAAQYLKGALPLFWPLIQVLRSWDRRGAKDVSIFIGISKFVSARIRKFYGRKSAVVYPPVATEWLAKDFERPITEPYFLIAGALVPYKRIELAVQACTSARSRLVVAGSGPLADSLKKIAGPTVSFEGRVSDQKLGALYKHCLAFLFLAEEDFGIMPIEALAAGRPVVARFCGAARETIKSFRPWVQQKPPHDAVGVFCRPEPVGSTEEIEALKEALRAVEQHQSAFSVEVIQSEARRFSSGEFYRSWCRAVPAELNPALNESSFVDAFEKARVGIQ